MKLTKYLVLLLQASITFACFTSSARRRMNKRWEMQCDRGIQFLGGRQAALNRFFSCSLFGLTESWGRQRRSTDDEMLTDDIVLIANETEIQAFTESTSVWATLNVEFVNKTYVVTLEDVCDNKQCGITNFKRGKRDVGLPFEVELPQIQYKNEPTVVYSGKSGNVNGKVNVVFKQKRYAKQKGRKNKPSPNAPPKGPRKPPSTTTTARTTTTTPKTTTTTPKTTTTTPKTTVTTPKTTTTTPKTTTTTTKTTTTASKPTTTIKTTTTEKSTTAATTEATTRPFKSNDTATKPVVSNNATSSSSKTGNATRPGDSKEPASTDNNEDDNKPTDGNDHSKLSDGSGHQNFTSVKSTNLATMSSNSSKNDKSNRTVTKPPKLPSLVVTDRKHSNTALESKNSEKKGKVPAESSNKWMLSLLAVPGLGLPAGIGMFLWKFPNAALMVLRCFTCKKRNNSMEMRG